MKVRISQSKKWCFTWNNYPETGVEQMEQALRLANLRYIFGKEVGESGTPHLQGYCEGDKKFRWSELKLPETIHWETARGTKRDNSEYCSKEGKTYSRGIRMPRALKVLTDDDLKPWQKEIVEIIDTEPDDRTIHWYWSAAGGIGKTTFTKYLVHVHQATLLSGKGADVRNGVISHVQQHGETPELVVFPIPRSFNCEYLSYEALENVKDMLFYSGKYEGGAVCGNCPHLIVFANEPPDETKCSADRWRVVNID